MSRGTPEARTHSDESAVPSRIRSRPTDTGVELSDSSGLSADYHQGADPYETPAPEDELPGFHWDRGAISSSGWEVTPRGIVEALLFVGHPRGEPISSRHLAALMRGVRPGEVDEIVRELNEEYAHLGCPWVIEARETGYCLVLREEYASLADVFQGKVREARLSQAAIDILAIVAYQQPIERSKIRELSSTATPALLSQLVRRGLLSAENAPGNRREVIYRTTDRFLEQFGLESLEELPRGGDADFADY